MLEFDSTSVPKVEFHLYLLIITMEFFDHLLAVLLSFSLVLCIELLQAYFGPCYCTLCNFSFIATCSGSSTDPIFIVFTFLRFSFANKDWFDYIFSTISKPPVQSFIMS